MALKKVLITVKTYPAISKKCEELVCTAGSKSRASRLVSEVEPYSRGLVGISIFKYFVIIQVPITHASMVR